MNKIVELWDKIMVRYGSDYFFALPSDSLIVWIYFGFYGTLLVLALAFYFYFRYKARSEKPYASFAGAMLWPNVTFVAVGLLLTFFRYEQIPVLAWRFWMYILLVSLIAFNAWFFSARRQRLLDELDSFNEKKRKDKWLTKKHNK